MKRLYAVASLALLLAAPAIAAEGQMGGPGFRLVPSPFSPLVTAVISPVEATPTIGLRHWMNPKVGVDFALGYTNLNIDPGSTQFSGFVFDVGLPLSVKKVSESVNFIFRPGLRYSTIEDESGTPSVKWTGMQFLGELEVEWMVTERLSVSAAHGIAYNTLSDDGDPKTELTSFGTTGSTFSNLGFHVYLW